MDQTKGGTPYRNEASRPGTVISQQIIPIGKTTAEALGSKESKSIMQGTNIVNNIFNGSPARLHGMVAHDQTPKRVYRNCAAAGCKNKAISKQYCTTHGAKGKCKHDGCATNIDRNGLCKKHFSRGTCSETDCSKYVEARGLCDSHWKEKRGQLQARSNNQDNKGPPTSPKRATRGNWQRAAKRKAPVSSQAGKPPRKVKPTTAQRSNKSQAKARRTTSAPTTLSTTPAPAQAPAATTTTVFAPAHPATYSTPMLIPKHLQLQLQQQQREIQQPASLQHYDHTLSAAAVQRLATARVQQGTCPAVTPVLQTQLLAEAPDQQHQHLLYLQHANARLVVQQSQSHLTQQLHHPGHHLRQQHESYPLLALQERAHVHAYVPVQLPTPACGLRLDASASSHVHSGMHASAGYMSDTSQSGPHE